MSLLDIGDMWLLLTVLQGPTASCCCPQSVGAQCKGRCTHVGKGGVVHVGPNRSTGEVVWTLSHRHGRCTMGVVLGCIYRFGVGQGVCLGGGG